MEDNSNTNQCPAELPNKPEFYKLLTKMNLDIGCNIAINTGKFTWTGGSILLGTRDKKVLDCVERGPQHTQSLCVTRLRTNVLPDDESIMREIERVALELRQQLLDNDLILQVRFRVHVGCKLKRDYVVQTGWDDIEQKVTIVKRICEEKPREHEEDPENPRDETQYSMSEAEHDRYESIDWSKF